jgi:hypothetical protein
MPQNIEPLVQATLSDLETDDCDLLWVFDAVRRLSPGASYKDNRESTLTLHAMKKTSLYLDDGDVERVRRLAQREGRSQADVVRAALAAYESQLVAQRRFSLTGSAEGDGQSVADLPEEDFLQGFGN